MAQLYLIVDVGLGYFALGLVVRVAVVAGCGLAEVLGVEGVLGWGLWYVVDFV